MFESVLRRLRMDVSAFANEFFILLSFRRDRQVESYKETFGDGASTLYTFTHNLATLDVQVEVWTVADGQTESGLTIKRTDINTVTVTYAGAPAANSRRVLIMKAFA